MDSGTCGNSENLPNNRLICLFYKTDQNALFCGEGTCHYGIVKPSCRRSWVGLSTMDREKLGWMKHDGQGEARLDGRHGLVEGSLILTSRYG